MIVDQEVAAIDDFFRDQERGALGLSAVGFAGIEAVHAFVVDGIDVRDFLEEGRNVDEREQNDGAGELGGINGGNQFFESDDGGVLGAMGAGDQGEHGAGICAVENDDGDASGGVSAGGNVEVAVGALAGGGGGAANGVRV